jgi:hypothetical protein
MVDCQIFLCQNSGNLFENIKGWQLFCEDGP